MGRMSVRGFAVASATAVTAVGSVVGMASAGNAQPGGTEAAAGDTTLFADIPVGQQVQTASLVQQVDAQGIAADASAMKDAEEAARKAAAQSAVERKAAAQKAEEQAKAKLAARTTYSVAQIQALAAQMVPAGQFQCFSNIVSHESGWNYHAVNAASGAYGLFQALPGNKMASTGSDWQTNPVTQIKWGLTYMNNAYGSPCQAWTFWQAHHWY